MMIMWGGDYSLPHYQKGVAMITTEDKNNDECCVCEKCHVVSFVRELNNGKCPKCGGEVRMLSNDKTKVVIK